MSLEQLEKQIQMASLAMEKATKSGNKQLKGNVLKELANFQKVLEKSRARLKELEMIKKQCDNISAVRDSRIREIEGPELKKTTSIQSKSSQMKKERIHPVITSLVEQKPEENESEQPKPEETNQEEDRNDVDNGGWYLGLAFSFGNQFMASAADMASVSSFGSQIFGTSEITKAVNKEMEIYSNQKKTQVQRARTAEIPRPTTALERPASDLNRPSSFLDSFRRLGTFGSTRTRSTRDPEPEDREMPLESHPEDSEMPLEVIHSFMSKDEQQLSAEDIAERELKAREKYIQLSKEHQVLRRTGLPEDSPQIVHSQKLMRDCYAEIEYWECLAEEASKSSSEGKSNVLKSTVFLGRNPLKSPKLDVDEETAKARDAYSYAMMCHQGSWQSVSVQLRRSGLIPRLGSTKH